MYKIYFEGTWYMYGTHTDAKARAEYIFKRTGIIVGIEKM